MGRIALRVVVACILCAWYARAEHFHIKPYVSDIASGSVALQWVGDRGLPSTCTVQLGTSRYMRTVSADSLPGVASMLYRVVLDSLRDGVDYTYSVTLGGSAIDGGFRTLAPRSSPVTIAVYGDSRSHPEKHAQVASAIAATGAHFVLMTGDLVADGNVFEQWAPQFFAPAAPFLSQATVFPVKGTHDGDGGLFARFWQTPGNGDVYSRDIGDVHIVGIDQLAPRERYPAILGWVEKDLMASRARWKVVVYHEPSYNIGGHGSSWGRSDFVPLLERCGVDLVLTGHSHLYERFMPIGAPGAKPVTHVVTGGGGAPLYQAGHSPLLVGGVSLPELHFCLIRTHGDTLRFQALRPDASVFDSLTLVRTGTAYQPEVMNLAVTPGYADTLLRMLRACVGSFEPAVPQNGTSALVSVDASGWPEGAQVSVFPPEGDCAWRVDTVRTEVRQGRFMFRATPLVGLTPTFKGFSEALWVGIELTPASGVRIRVPRLVVAVDEKQVQVRVPAAVPVAVRRARRAVVVDGDAAEWSRVPALPLKVKPEYAGTVRMCWRDEGLYGLVVAVDSQVQSNPRAPWSGDGLELFLDKDHSRVVTGGQTTEQLCLFPVAEGNAAGWRVVSGANNGRTDLGIVAAWKPTSDGYSMEFFVPATALAPAVWREGSVLGMNFAIDDSGRAVAQFYCDKDIDEAYRRPVLWGSIQLSGR